jgi:pyridoxamine 5'-phosphate oxidase
MFQDCMDFANQNPICYLATVEADQPHVRGMMMWFADEKGFHFSTGTIKPLYKQLQKNAKVELCFFSPGTNPAAGKQMRVCGQVEFLNDRPLKERLLNEKPFLKAIVQGNVDDPLLSIFRVCTGEAWFWTMADNLKPNTQKIRF